MSEETRNAAMAGPMGIVIAIGISVVLGWCLMVALLFCVQDFAGTINSATGEPVAQIFLDTVREKGAIVLMVCTATLVEPVMFHSCNTGYRHRGHVLLRDVLHYV